MKIGCTRTTGSSYRIRRGRLRFGSQQGILRSRFPARIIVQSEAREQRQMNPRVDHDRLSRQAGLDRWVSVKCGCQSRSGSPRSSALAHLHRQVVRFNHGLGVAIGCLAGSPDKLWDFNSGALPISGPAACR